MKKSMFNFSGKTFLIFLLAGGFIVSCNKKKDDLNLAKEIFEEDYFTILDASFRPGPLPEANSDELEIFSITGNTTVIAGGSNLIGIKASNNTRSVVAGILDDEGYFLVPTTSSAGGSQVTVNLQMLISRQTSDNYTVAFSVTDNNGNYGDYEYLEVNLQEAGIGNLQISLTWDQANDVDLHLMQPDEQHIYYGNRLSDNGGWLDLDSNPACYIDGVNNENIFYADTTNVTIQNGVYEVLVDLWANCSIADTTNYAIVAYYGENIITPIEGENPYYGQLKPSDESFNSNLISVMKFRITGETDIEGANKIAQKSYNALAPMNNHRVANFRFDENNKVFKSYSVKE